jgi:hypothetical protein
MTDDWPDDVEEVETGERGRTEAAADLMDASEGQCLDSVDLKYLLIVNFLARPAAYQKTAMLSLSDKVTSHMVSYAGFSMAGGDYQIGYWDPWGEEQSFLEAGKNIAGVSATKARGPGWTVSAWDLARVLDGIIAVALPGASDAK